MSSETKILTSHFDANNKGSGSIYHTPSNELKLQFFNKCVDNAKKYRLVELTRVENDFKRKYSWCLDEGKQNGGRLSRRSLPLQSENRNLRKDSITRRVSFITHAFKEKKTTSSLQSEPDECMFTHTGRCASQPLGYPDIGITTSTARSSSTDGRHSSFQRPLHTDRGTVSLHRRRASVRNSVSCPASRSERSPINTYSNYGLSRFEDLWDKVFKSDVEDDTYTGQKARQQERTAKERFSCILLRQYKGGAPSEQQSAERRTSMEKRGSLDLPWHSTPRTTMPASLTFHEPATTRSSGNGNDDNVTKNEWNQNALNCVDDRYLKKAVEADRHERRGIELGENTREQDEGRATYGCLGGRHEDDSKNAQIDPKTEALDTNVSVSPSLTFLEGDPGRRKIPLPPMRSRKGSPLGIGLNRGSYLYSKWIRGLWRICLLGILATRTGRSTLYRYVKLAVQREKTAFAKGKLWQIDMRKCHYLRIAKSHKETTEQSDPDSD